MPKLQEYVAPSRTLNPSSAGYSAYQTAGRRVGGMMRQAGEDMVRAARAQGQVLTDKAQWPFTLFDLKQKFTKPAAGTGEDTSVSFGVRPSRGSMADEQFAPRVMPNLARANLSSQMEEGYDNRLAGRLSPYGARQESIANQAALLAEETRALIGTPGSGVYRQRPLGPSQNPGVDPAWAQSVTGQAVDTGLSSNDPGYADYGGGGDTVPTRTPSIQMPGGAGQGTLDILRDRE
jgi:hypothetical protein